MKWTGLNELREMYLSFFESKGHLRLPSFPLIPQNEMKDLKAPTCEELYKARAEAEVYINVFRHCQHCRADACGVPGVYDIGASLYKGRLNVKETFSHG